VINVREVAVGGRRAEVRSPGLSDREVQPLENRHVRAPDLWPGTRSTDKRAERSRGRRRRAGGVPNAVTRVTHVTYRAHPVSICAIAIDGTRPVAIRVTQSRQDRRRGSVRNRRTVAVFLVALVVPAGLASSAGAAQQSVSAGIYVRTNGPAHELLVVDVNGHKYECAGKHVAETVTKTAHTVQYVFDCGHIDVRYQAGYVKIDLHLKVGSWTHACAASYRVGKVSHPPYNYKYGVWRCR
jgi:hypothetical protein